VRNKRERYRSDNIRMDDNSETQKNYLTKRHRTKTDKAKNTTQKIKTMSNTGPYKNPGVNVGVLERFLLH
jgi:hypothetical protein